MRLDYFLKESKGRNLMSKARLFHNIEQSAYINYSSMNELEQTLLTGGLG